MHCNLLVENLCQVLVGDATFIHGRLKLLLHIYHLRCGLSLLLHHDYGGLTHLVVDLTPKSTAIDYIRRVVSFVLILSHATAVLLETSTFFLISTILLAILCCGIPEEVIRENRGRRLVAMRRFCLLKDLLVTKGQLVFGLGYKVPTVCKVESL